MKKVFSALTVIVALFLVSCMSEIKELSSTNQKGNVALFIGNSSPKTISPAAGLSWRNVSEWTAEFTETNGKYDTIYFYSLDFSKGSYVLKLPVGNFSVKLYGFTSGTTPVKYSGIASVSISEEITESVQLPIFVSTEKTEAGKGSFQFTLGISTDSKESISIVSAILESKSDSLQDVTLAVTQNQETGKYTLTAESIPSGFYDLSVKCTVGSTTETVGSTTEKEIFKNYYDSVVEIIDGMTTSGSKDITVVTGNTKTYYCTLGKSEGNGLWKAYPANIDDVLTDETVKEVNINMTDGIPAIDLAKIGNKVYYIYDNTEILVYTIDGTTDAGAGPGIALSSIDSLTLKDSSGSNLKADISGDIDTIIYLTLEDNTSIRSTVVATNVVFANTKYNSYYAENPFYTTSSQDCTVTIGEALANNYTVTKKTVSETEYNYYVVPSVNSAVSAQGIPTWSIKAEPGMENSGDNSYTVFAGDSVTYKASFDEEFTPDSFAWYINGEQYSTTGAEISVTLSDLDTKKYNPGDKNTILCVVSKNGEYSSKAVEITALPETYVLYEKSPYYNVGYTYSNSNPIEYTSIVNSVADFCTDEIGNIYTLSSDGTVTKYEKSSTGFNENIICTIPGVLTDIANDFSYKYIEVSNGYVFVSGSLYSNNDSKDIYSCIKVSLDSSEVTKLGDFTGSVRTFSPYNGGEYIYSIESIESDSSAAYTLNKYSTSNGALTNSAASILCSTDSASTDETVLKDYVTSANYYNFFLKDMYSTNGYIYVTASETGAALYDPLSENAVSRGGVIKFSTEDLSVQSDASGAIIYGWDTADVTGTSETDVTNAHTSPNTTFYGAEKIIAVKPEEIVIADDGFEFTGTGAGHLKQKNRVVTFSLKQMAITSVVDDVAYEFDRYFSGSAFNN